MGGKRAECEPLRRDTPFWQRQDKTLAGVVVILGKGDVLRLLTGIKFEMWGPQFTHPFIKNLLSRHPMASPLGPTFRTRKLVKELLYVLGHVLG